MSYSHLGAPPEREPAAALPPDVAPSLLHETFVPIRRQRGWVAVPTHDMRQYAQTQIITVAVGFGIGMTVGALFGNILAGQKVKLPGVGALMGNRRRTSRRRRRRRRTRRNARRTSRTKKSRKPAPIRSVVDPKGSYSIFEELSYIGDHKGWVAVLTSDRSVKSSTYPSWKSAVRDLEKKAGRKLRPWTYADADPDRFIVKSKAKKPASWTKVKRNARKTSRSKKSHQLTVRRFIGPKLGSGRWGRSIGGFSYGDKKKAQELARQKARENPGQRWCIRVELKEWSPAKRRFMYPVTGCFHDPLRRNARKTSRRVSKRKRERGRPTAQAVTEDLVVKMPDGHVEVMVQGGIVKVEGTVYGAVYDMGTSYRAIPQGGGYKEYRKIKGDSPVRDFGTLAGAVKHVIRHGRKAVA